MVGQRALVFLGTVFEKARKALPWRSRKRFMERSWVLLRKEEWLLRTKEQDGSWGSVDFDWQWVYDRQDIYEDVAGFAHTHPPGVGTDPSATDRVTMAGWCMALGTDLQCAIECDGVTAIHYFESWDPSDEPVLIGEFNEGIESLFTAKGVEDADP